MKFSGLKVGFAVTGSFCTIGKVIPEMVKLISEGAEIIPIFSKNVFETDNRFNKKDDLISTVSKLCGRDVIHTIKAAEPIGPKNLLDALIIAPCTGNTLAKIANGITDTSVTMASKATLRNKKPVIIAISTNDGLSGSAKNIGVLLNTKNTYFVPFGQDDPISKETSLVADFSRITPTLECALLNKQLQPVIF